ncbi:ImcF-related family protein, partial [Pseudomonas viridiflava]|uniref:ImcF-related family protein n=1 Tax=Pseudomonas viridiflava TaxID=33069 RepID=UPI0013CF157A
LYLRDYANYWGEAVGQVQLPAINDFGEGAEQLAGLTSANSPIIQMLVEVRENTRFPVVADTADEAADAAGQLAENGGKLGKLAAAAAGKASDALAKNLPDTAR